MLLSIISPSRDESRNIPRTLRAIIQTLDKKNILFEIVVVDDYSRDKTEKILEVWERKDKRVQYIKNDYPPGFGFAVRKGLDVYKGDVAVIVMADGSDDPLDIVKYYERILEGYDCVFGTRFCKDSVVLNYPIHKLVLNRIGNWFIRILFWIPYNDVTNAFKCYRRKTIDGIKPLISCYFNLTVEMPLKAIIRGYNWCVVPINWRGRKRGISKMKIKEIGSRYWFIILSVLLEKILSRGDYRKGQYWLARTKDQK